MSEEAVRPPVGVVQADLAGKNARFTTPKEYAEHIFAADRVVNFQPPPATLALRSRRIRRH